MAEHIHHIPGRQVLIQDKVYGYFSGTGYLGISDHPLFRERVKAGIDAYGVHFGGSRLGNIGLAIFAEAEAWLADFAGAPAALVLSSGTLCGQFLMACLQEEGDIQLAPGMHPAAWRQIRPFAGTNTAWCSAMLRLAQRDKRPQILVSSTVDPLFSKSYSFDWLKEWPEDTPLLLVMDDSHGLGVCGANGAGIWQELVATGKGELIVFSSLGKALGIPGGVILGQPDRIQQLKTNPLFGGASPISPAFLYAMIHSRQLYQKQLQKLRANILFFEAATRPLNLFQSFSEYPVFYTAESGLALYLFDRGFVISQFAYPSPQDDVITRIVISAAHELSDLERLVSELSGYK
ncbi:MAG TPA: aminotransferase class I/II-fold pyridoxal phosphate-dependent enzyme [Saprospiraceae bacterium]|nr:aminotransferase class I/II-fold pyridoxal phosphate-dependent enzyme [Saprospiraceae bacterium]HMQ82752.1 aminotransferase class I/II-fold pyridoxal phosphate-dependent enzyme [Saprospiraceae bacterium]